jgi:hypothetical protein
MTMESKSAIVVTGIMTALLILSMSVATVPVPVASQGPSASGGDPTSFLESAKMHLIEATKDLKMGNSQAALEQLNMTHQGIISAERRNMQQRKQRRLLCSSLAIHLAEQLNYYALF